ncbi:MAG: hypothetical protein Q8941_12850 [Bacteroidota bacterium]|nr:hypothetical protein [Bacteroidota bacterium]
MEAKATSERDLVKKCMTELCSKAGFADCQNMVQRDLEFLCDSIEAKTGVLISLSTIKRLMNGQFSRLPQIATLNAISMFLGYQNWQEFKLSKAPAPNGSINGANKEKLAAQRTLPLLRFSYTRLLLPAGLLIFTALGLFFMLKPGKHPPANFEKAVFTVNKTTSNDLPNTVVFNYNIDDVNADSFFIQQSWDRNRRVRIYKKSYTLTDIYYEPGYHNAKLIANDQVIKTLPVSIPTDRWFFYAKEKIPRSIPKYISLANGFKDGKLGMDKDEILNSQVDIQKENTYIQVYFPSVFESNSDNFILNCRVRVNELRHNFCPYFMCEVFCQKNFMFFTSTPKGCSSEINAQYGENFTSGKTHDLSAMGTDVKEWQDVEVNVKNRKVTIRINKAEVFTTSYQEPSGLITGLGFISNGICEVDFVSLKTQDGKSIYSNDFGK